MRAPAYILRLLFLGLAVLIWGNVVAYRQTARSIELPIYLSNIPAGLAVGELPPMLQVRVSGTVAALGKITDQTLRFQLDLSSAILGQTYVGQVQQQGAITGVTVLGYEPQQVSLPIDAATVISLPVVVESSGALADGYKLVSVAATPSQVNVSGSANLIGKIGQAIARVDVTNRKGAFTLPAGIVLDSCYPAAFSALPISPANVTIQVDIQPGNASRSLGIKPSLSGHIPDGYFVREVKFDPPLVTLLGNDRALQDIVDLFSTPIKLDGHRQTFSEQVSVVLPRGIKVDGDNLLRATVEVELSEASREFSVAPQFTNIGEGLTVKSVDPKTIQVVVIGQPDALQQVTRSQVELMVDLSGVLTGSTKVPLSAGMFQLPAGVSVGSFTPEEIEVILTRS